RPRAGVAAPGLRHRSQSPSFGRHLGALPCAAVFRRPPRSPAMSRLAPFRRLVPFAALLGLLLGAPAQAALPLPDDDRPLLRIHGSNTIGARLAPALVAGLLEREGFGSLRIEPGRLANEQRLSARDAQGRRVTVEIAAHGSGTG